MSPFSINIKFKLVVSGRYAAKCLKHCGTTLNWTHLHQVGPSVKGTAQKHVRSPKRPHEPHRNQDHPRDSAGFPRGGHAPGTRIDRPPNRARARTQTDVPRDFSTLHDAAGARASYHPRHTAAESRHRPPAEEEEEEEANRIRARECETENRGARELMETSQGIWTRERARKRGGRSSSTKEDVKIEREERERENPAAAIRSKKW